jgi:hypothetical protein
MHLAFRRTRRRGRVGGLLHCGKAPALHDGRIGAVPTVSAETARQHAGHNVPRDIGIWGLGYWFTAVQQGGRKLALLPGAPLNPTWVSRPIKSQSRGPF